MKGQGEWTLARESKGEGPERARDGGGKGTQVKGEAKEQRERKIA